MSKIVKNSILIIHITQKADQKSDRLYYQ